MEGLDLSGISQEEFSRTQRVLDVEKWLASERAGRDLCGTMSWCAFCVKAEVHPCAKAQFREKLSAELERIVEEEAEESAAAADEAAGEGDTDEVLAEAAMEEAAEEDIAAPSSEEKLDKEELFSEIAASAGGKRENEPDAAEEAAVPEGYERVVRYRRSFRSRIIQNAPLQDAYTELKNALLAYSGVKARVCQNGENFRIGKKKVAKLAVSGKTLSLFLALDPSEFEDTSYRFEDMSEKKSHRETPMRVKITSRRALKQARELLACMAGKEGIAEVGCIYTDFHFAYRSDEYLIGKGLIRPYTALVRKKK